jgi:hypothetical protein
MNSTWFSTLDCRPHRDSSSGAHPDRRSSEPRFPNPDDVILEVLQRGHRQGAEILRPTKVVVNGLTRKSSGRLR